MQTKYKRLAPMLFTLCSFGSLVSSTSVEANENNTQSDENFYHSALTSIGSIKPDLQKNYGIHFGGIVSSFYQKSSKKMYRHFPVSPEMSDEAFTTQFVGLGGWDFYHNDDLNISINGEYTGYLSGSSTSSLTDPLSGTLDQRWKSQLKQVYFTLDYGNNSLKVGRMDPTIEVVGWSGGHQFFNFMSFQLSGSTWLQPPYPGVGVSYTYNFTKDKLNYVRFVATDASGNFNTGPGYKNLYKGDLWKAIEFAYGNKRTGEGSAAVKFTLYDINKSFYFQDDRNPTGKTTNRTQGLGIQGDYEISNGIKLFSRLGVARYSKADFAITAGFLAPAHIFNRAQDTIGLGYSYSKPAKIFQSVSDKNEQLLEGFYKYNLSRYDNLSVILSYIKNPMFTDGGTSANIPLPEKNLVSSNFITTVRYTVMF
ncbi:carbohydrate porin [Shewanella intestini]|uniref:Carbohydrate porin n=1 Tax=Shewanella intestini TaxID=2017544 RepID=A0ABS5I1R7_9GAMM|nr:MULTISPECIES: carbohydrate porin [Shewanella]MBR9727773.1 carbohydrate porin [Shewanella intestini]MRG36234.1 hypothetical protein [Shewanella sp. XMDDZSB0408]